MEIKDNKTGIPLEFYTEKFSAKDPEEMSRRTGVPYADGKFTFAFLGREVTVEYPSMEAVYAVSGDKTKSNIRILLGRFLMEGNPVTAGGKMLSYTEMPWGNVYEAQFKGRCIMRLAFGFGRSLESFEKACLSVGGTAAKGGDMAFDMSLIEGFTVRMIIWEGDEEFQPSSQILFSDNFPSAFSAEDMAVVGDIILDAMKGRW